MKSLDNSGDKIISGINALKDFQDEDYIPVRFAYIKEYSSLLALLIHINKLIKRKFRKESKTTYRVRFSSLISNNILRGIRNKENAYMLTNKRWRLTQEEASKKYEDLYNSIKEKGYDENFPLYIALNRHLGVKDQLLQGHHRMGICQELKIKEVAVSFFMFPSSFKIFRMFTNIKKD